MLTRRPAVSHLTVSPIAMLRVLRAGQDREHISMTFPGAGARRLRSRGGCDGEAAGREPGGACGVLAGSPTAGALRQPGAGLRRPAGTGAGAPSREPRALPWQHRPRPRARSARADLLFRHDCICMKGTRWALTHKLALVSCSREHFPAAPTVNAAFFHGEENSITAPDSHRGQEPSPGGGGSAPRLVCTSNPGA